MVNKLCPIFTGPSSSPYLSIIFKSYPGYNSLKLDLNGLLAPCKEQHQFLLQCLLNILVQSLPSSKEFELVHQHIQLFQLS